MPIENRDLPVGTRLVAKYKGVTFIAEKQADGYNVIEPAGHPATGRDYKSPSAAGSAVMGGTACNGWRFWSLEGEAAAAAADKPVRAPKAKSGAKAKAAKPKGQRKPKVGKFSAATRTRRGWARARSAGGARPAWTTSWSSARRSRRSAPTGTGSTTPS